MPGHILDYHCDSCGLRGGVSPGSSMIDRKSYVIAYDPGKEIFVTVEYSEAIKNGLEIYENPYVAGENWMWPVSSRDKDGMDAGRRSPVKCPRCRQGLVTFTHTGFWD